MGVKLRVVRYPEQFTVELQKNGGILGFKFECPQSPSNRSSGRNEVRISQVLTEGALHNYNKEQASLGRWHYVVLPNMRIVSVNGARGDIMQIKEELKANDTVVIQVRRCEQSKESF